MPIYEYVCQRCGQQTEVIQKFSDAPLTQCESCSGELRKLISRTTFQLKGGGWYATDYKKGGSTSVAAAPATESKATDSTTPAPVTPAKKTDE